MQQLSDNSTPRSRDTGEAATLLPRVQEILGRISSPDERDRYHRFFASAARAIEQLGELDVAAGTRDAADSDAVALWSEVAPGIHEALGRVSELLELVGREFPAEAGDEEDLDLEVEMGGEAGERRHEPRPQTPSVRSPAAPDECPPETAQMLEAFRANLSHELHAVGELRPPASMDEMWGLLERLGELRGRSRSAIGEMVFTVARLFAVVRKEDVVPFYKEDVDASLRLRREIATLSARIGLHRARLARLESSDGHAAVGERLAALREELGRFMRGELYRSMRAIDKRAFVGVRREISSLIDGSRQSARAVETAVEGLVRFLDSLSLMNRRELLIIHDREAAADCELHLQSVMEAVADNDARSAREALSRAVQIADQLFGREPALDGLLTLLRNVDLGKVEQPDLLGMAQLLGEKI